MKCEKELALLREDIRKGRKNKKITQEELAEKLEQTRRKETEQVLARDREVMEKYRQQ